MTTWSDAEKADWRSYLRALYPKAREWEAARDELYVHACQRYPLWAAKEALRDFRTKEKGETAPSPAAMAGGARQVTSAFLARKEREGQYKRAQEDGEVLTPQQFAEDEEFWGPRVRRLDPRVRASYLHLREVCRRGGIPGLTTREPGEEG